MPSSTSPHSKPVRRRADELLVARGLVPSRTQAQALILAGQVRTGPDSVIAKPSQLLPEDSFLQIAQPARFVGRGGEKIDAFLEKFSIDVRGVHALDIGASTGGFTDCLLQRGAADVTCVDVGHGQLHAKLRNDLRVTNFEKINARELQNISLPRETYAVVVIDVSFISLTKILPPAWARVSNCGKLIALVKPQFEATKAEASIGRGIIRDTIIHQRVLDNIRNFAAQELPGVKIFGEMESPITGGDGNKEFLVGFGKE